MTVLLGPEPLTRFVLPKASFAAEPAEYRGITRDGVRLMVAGRESGMSHHVFRDVVDLLDPGDLLVINTSRTLPAALDSNVEGDLPRPMHISTELPSGDWVVEVRLPDNSGPDRGLSPGTILTLPGRVSVHLLSPYPDPTSEASRLWRAVPMPRIDRADYLRLHGRPIAYGERWRRFPLADYQTVYARSADDEVGGSAEMPSAGRPFTTELLTRAVARGIAVAPVVLHAGVSSPESHEPPMPERFTVPGSTGRLVQSTRASGGRVVAVGTTVVRALETAARPNGSVPATEGWTELVLGPDRGPRVVNGLISGLHEPEASHLLLLEAVAGPGLVAEAYRAAVAEDYLWHEFGDSMLFLP